MTCDSPWRSLYFHTSSRVSPTPRDSSVPGVAGLQFLEILFCEVIHLASEVIHLASEVVHLASEVYT